MAWTPPATWNASEVVTATKMNTHVRDNMKEVWRRLAYVEYTANVVLNAVILETAPTDIVSSGAITYTAEPIEVQFYTPRLITGSTPAGGLNLWDATTDLGRIAQWGTSGNSDFPSAPTPRFLTPTAASHTYKIRGWVSGGNATISAGAGGAGVLMPGFIVIWQKGGP